MPEPKVIGNQKISAIYNVIHDRNEPCVNSNDAVLHGTFGLFDHEIESSEEAAFAVEQIKNEGYTLPSINAFKHDVYKKSSAITCTDEDSGNDLDSHEQHASLSYPTINFLQEKDLCSEKICMPDILNANFNAKQNKPSRYSRKEPSEYSSKIKNKLTNEIPSQFSIECAKNEFAGKTTIFHDTAASAFIPVPKKSPIPPIVPDSEKTHLSKFGNYSHTYAYSENNYPGIPGMNPPSSSYSEDQESFLADIFSSGESGNFTSSNEWISNDETECGRLSNAYISPGGYPECLMNLSPKTNPHMQSFCNTENAFHHNLSSNTLSMSNDNYHEQASNSKREHIFSSCRNSYYAPETKRHKLCGNFQVTSDGLISNDLINFHENEPEYYYLYQNSDDMPVETITAMEQIQDKELCVPDDENVNFYETLQSSNFFNYPKPSESSCEILGGVRIKQEIPDDALPDEEISYSLNNLNDFYWSTES